MKNVSLLITVTVSIILFVTFCVQAQPATVADDYRDDQAGYGLTVYDVNGDGYNDIVTSHYYDGGELFLNYDDETVGDFSNESEGLAKGREAKFGNLGGSSPWYLAMASMYNTDELEIYEIDNNQLEPFQTLDDASVDYVSWGYLNNDVNCDLIASSIGSNTLVYLFENVSNSLSYDTYFDCGTNTDPDQVALVPIINERWDDDEWDLVVRDGTYGYIRMYPNSGAGTFTSTGSQNVSIGGVANDMVIGDVDRDGFNDLVVCVGSYVKMYRNNQSGAFTTDPLLESYDFGAQVEQVMLGDYDYDGYQDLLVWVGYEYAKIYLNEGVSDPGDFDFTSADWTGWTDISGYGWEGEELIFADLNSKGALSVVWTGWDATLTYLEYMCVWFNNDNPAVTPVQNVQAQESAGGYAQITWEANIELDIDKYTIYRALMDTSTSKPDREDFDSPSTINHPTCTYTDTEVEWHSQSSNYYVWYAVTGIDEDGNESGLLEYAKGWGYYSEGGVCETIFFNKPDQFKMSAAPNPFNPTTTLRYEMPTDAHVTLRVFDISGREVATLMDAHREAGTHNLTWDAGHLPSGVYFAQIQAGEYTFVQKLMLVK